MERKKYQLKKKTDRINTDLCNYKYVIKSTTKKIFKSNLISTNVYKEYFVLTFSNKPRKLLLINMGIKLAKSRLRKYLGVAEKPKNY